MSELKRAGAVGFVFCASKERSPRISGFYLSKEVVEQLLKNQTEREEMAAALQISLSEIRRQGSADQFEQEEMAAALQIVVDRLRRGAVAYIKRQVSCVLMGVRSRMLRGCHRLDGHKKQCQCT